MNADQLRKAYLEQSSKGSVTAEEQLQAFINWILDSSTIGSRLRRTFVSAASAEWLSFLEDEGVTRRYPEDPKALLTVLDRFLIAAQITEENSDAGTTTTQS